MFGGSFDLAVLSGPLALQRTKQLAKRFCWSGCDCRCLRGEGRPPQVLPDCRHRQLGVLF
ncbi:MAG: hypothetical protein GDA36_11575 [Rhodobacteraceae bacterium]|nr:hypothetical protein [Paracoccaceae bacterium]